MLLLLLNQDLLYKMSKAKIPFSGLTKLLMLCLTYCKAVIYDSANEETLTPVMVV